MSQWTDRILEHRVMTCLDSLGPALDRAAQRDDITSETQAGLERLRVILAFAGKRIASFDPMLAFLQPLDNVAESFEAAETDVGNFTSDGNAQHITNANAKIEPALRHLCEVPLAITPDETGAIRAAVSNYRQVIETELQKIQKAFKSLQNDAEEARTHVTEATNVSKTRLTELATEIATERQTLTSLASDHQSQFSTTQATRETTFTESQTTRQAAFDTAIQGITRTLNDKRVETEAGLKVIAAHYETEHKEFTTKFSAEYDKILATVNEKKAEVEKLAGIIGNTGVSAGYVQNANYCRTSTWIWHGITLIAFIVAISIASTLFVGQSSGDITWQLIVAKLVVTFTVAGFAAYSARQADKYMSTERRSRKLAIELAALGPYLAPLPADKQDEFRLKLADLSFGKDDPTLQKSDRSPATIMDVLLGNKRAERVIEAIVDKVLAAKAK